MFNAIDATVVIFGFICLTSIVLKRWPALMHDDDRVTVGGGATCK
jgi:hypothetical protein